MKAQESTPVAAPPAPYYVYGVTWADSLGRQDAPGVEGAAVEPIVHEELAALASAISSPTIRARRRDLTSHADVLAEAFASGTVLPLRFGTVFEQRRSVVDEFLAPRYGELASLLEEYQGLVELRVSAFYREEVVLREIVESDRGISRLRDATRSLPQAAAQPQQIALGEAVAGSLAATSSADERRLLHELRPQALDVVVEERLADMQVLRASFLVDRRRIDDFDAALEAFARREGGRMQFKEIGPLPPHSFVSLGEKRA
jgi:hypothetical protein